ncbi:LacI family DNA-binding transcriptional regulator [Psychrosphaera ytuae]|uniref:LacI family DNA-binding transcriptional regulator n=1 Tax=Psychrosphaera ytuae TaxID=2820710 RepID=A0A975D9G6_9GAMM|nr:LacI family DNA-binding transcriptional regulator [Psychrosphaera ytuae]QTH62764.1 LacI family DNA-binding transcriptional regulator [Psychrosphaera ytuae]
MATIYEVSELAGVSLATVSRVVNKNARVSDKTKEKVLNAMKELGYKPNSIAQSLASNRSNSIGLLVSELHGPFFGAMMSGIEAELRAAGKHTIIASGHSDEKTEQDSIEFLVGRKCDALILHAEAVSDEFLLELSKGTTPFVIINRIVPGIEEHCISLDNEHGGYLATKYLIEKGHTQFAYVSGPNWKKDARDRYAGHLRALAEQGLTQHPKLLVEGNFQQSGGRYGLEQCLSANLPFTALVCGNDEMASGAITRAREADLSVPDDFSIIGFDNIIYADYLFPKLTTIEYPVQKMGQMAAKLILANTYRIETGELTTEFTPRLIERDSCVNL